MAWRFKVSKYKNAAAILPKKEDWVSDVKVGAPTSCGNHIKASAAFIAFNVENRGGGSLGLLPLDYKGRLDSSSPLIHGHSDLITDFDFSPFDDGMLATCSTDAHVRIWHIPESGLKENLTDPEYSLPQFDKRVENVCFHPTADYLLTVAYFDTLKLWDIKHEKQIYCFSDHEDQVQSCSWRGNGSLLVTTAKDKTIRVLDPRSKIVAYEAEGHKTPKDSRVTWLGDTDRILSTGFDAHRTRELRIRDIRNFNKPLKVQTFDSSTGTLIPLYDPDTNMLFLAGKADVTIMYWEISDKDPFMTEGLKHNGKEDVFVLCSLQTKGACLVPKRGLNVMSGEVNRLLQLTSNAIVPLTYQVPRKTYREFHADLFPDTSGHNPSVTIQQWLNGANNPVKKISLDPAKNQGQSLHIFRGPLSKRREEDLTIDVETPIPAPRSCISNGVNKDNKISQVGFVKPFVAVKENNKNIINNDDGDGEQERRGLAQLKKAFEMPSGQDENVEIFGEENSSKLANIRKSFESRSISSDERNIVNDFHYSEQQQQKKEDHKEIEQQHTCVLDEKDNLEDQSDTGNSTGLTAMERRRTFEQRVSSVEEKPSSPTPKRASAGTRSFTNSEFVILPLNGPGGKLSVIRHQIGGRLPDGVIPSFVNGTSVLDFAFDPFNDNCLAAGNVTIIRWHPLSSGVMATACGDFVIRVWDIPSQRVSIILEGHLDQIFSMSWSPCGRFIATVCRDGKLRIYDPRKSNNPTHEGCGPPGVRGARILWVLDGRFIIVCGFSKISERQVSIFKANDLSKPLNTVTIDVNPAILVPAYDPDSSTLFVTGKGDSTIYAYEVGADAPHLFPLSHHKCCSVHQGFVILPKRLCDVRQVEFCRVLRLTQATLEHLSFTVPRIKTEYFQDDLFPPTQVTWEPVMTSAEWFGGTNRPPRLVSLQPPDMLSLSESRDGNSPSSVTAPLPAHSHVRHQTPPFLKGMVPPEAKETQHRLEESMNRQLDQVVTFKDQDNMEGVDAKEWNSEYLGSFKSNEFAWKLVKNIDVL
ncbi:Coronin-7 [Armadillidium nasatum]|uniref:Coronin n=1 Tax=Armadillidium nasatum TaxID=96803 RepID=A0A5N5STJ2_9CRUS|nr:Coronin-7 [Armadillidium nasatum]